jgi:hypothetical protein
MMKMRNCFFCPTCKGNLKVRKPNVYPRKWYKLISKHTLKCPYCGTEIVSRFADFDLGLTMIATSGGLVSLWGAGKVVLPILVGLVVMRLLLGKIVPKYVLATNRNIF